MRLSRRLVLFSGVTWAVPAFALRELEALEKRVGGAIGLFAARGRQSVAWRAKERFAYCSVFKWLLAAAALEAAQRGALALDERVRFTEADLLEPSTGTRPHLGTGLTWAQLCAAAVTVSDNTATQLLARRLGGPKALQAFARRLGDEVTRFDRWEPDLNTNLPLDPRDTTTPEAMTRLLRAAFSTEVLDAGSQRQLFAWMQATTTGLARLRAAAPKEWDVGDKTGTSGNGAFNDVAVLRPPTGAPFYVSVFVNARDANADTANAVIADVGRLVLERLG